MRHPRMRRNEYKILVSSRIPVQRREPATDYVHPELERRAVILPPFRLGERPWNRVRQPRGSQCLEAQKRFDSWMNPSA
jgi:hypothetical protein